MPVPNTTGSGSHVVVWVLGDGVQILLSQRCSQGGEALRRNNSLLGIGTMQQHITKRQRRFFSTDLAQCPESIGYPQHLLGERVPSDISLSGRVPGKQMDAGHRIGGADYQQLAGSLVPTEVSTKIPQESSA